MQPFEYLNTTYGLIWTISCIPIGCLLAFFGVWILNHIPAKWLCDYNETPDAELLSGKRFSYVSTGIPTAIAMAVCLVLCRLQFNKGYDIPDFKRHRTACKQEIVKIPVVDSLDAVPCADVFPAKDGKEVLSATSVITAHIGGTTVDIPSNIDQAFLSKIFKSLKECV